MQAFKKLLDHYFREDTRELPDTAEEYKKRLQEPIRCLTELEFGKTYNTNIRGVLARNGMQLDDIKIYAVDGEVIFYFSYLQPNMHVKTGRQTRVPYKANAEDVWIYRTSEMIDELVAEYKRKKAGEIPTPKSVAATAGTATPKSAVASTVTPTSQSVSTTPRTQSAAATPKTGSLAPTPTTQSAATTPRLGPAPPPPSPSSMKL